MGVCVIEEIFFGKIGLHPTNAGHIILQLQQMIVMIGSLFNLLWASRMQLISQNLWHNIIYILYVQKDKIKTGKDDLFANLQYDHEVSITATIIRLVCVIGEVFWKDRTASRINSGHYDNCNNVCDRWSSNLSHDGQMGHTSFDKNFTRGIFFI